MSYINPKAVLIDQPANIVAAIQKIQTELAELPWLDVAYGLASTGFSQDPNGKTNLEPEVYTGGGKYQLVTPNNFIASHLFFKQDSPARPIEWVPFQDNQYVASVSIIVLVNLEKIKAAMGFTWEHRFTEELKNEVLRLLKYNASFVISGIYDTPQEVFAGYTYDHLARQTFKHPEAGFRIQGDLVFQQTCPPTNMFE
jgi:hypothetical protein